MCIPTDGSSWFPSAPTPDASVSPEFVDRAYGPFDSAQPAAEVGKDAGKLDLGKMAGMAGLAAQAAGTFLAAGAASDKAKGTAAASRYNAALERNSASVTDQQAAVARENAQKNEQKLRMDAARLTSAQRARFAAAGLDMGEGSAFNILNDTTFMLNTDVGTLRTNADREAWALRETSKAKGANANLLDWVAGNEDASAGTLKAATLLSGAGSVASGWYRLQKGLAV